MRLSNAPTVVSNALAGLAIGGGRASTDLAADLGARAGPAAASVAGLVLVYSAGMILNDAADAEHDRVTRPGRPIPSGRIPRGHAFAVGTIGLAAGAMLVGAAMAARAGWVVAACLSGCVVLYTLVHKHAASVFGAGLMGACRGLVYTAAFAVVVDPFEHSSWIGPAIGAVLYTGAISLAARREDRMTLPLFGRSAPLVLALATVGASCPLDWPVALACMPIVVVHAHHAFKPAESGCAVPRLVQVWIAAFALTDAAICIGHGRWGLAAVCWACHALTRFGQRRIAGT